MRTSILAVFIAAGVSLTSTAVSASDTTQASRSHTVASVGDYIERGTPRIQVIAKLGQPAERLSPDVWVYRHLGNPLDARADATCRTLLIRFAAGRVVEMRLANEPAVMQVAAELRARNTGKVVAASDTEHGSTHR